MTKHFIGDWRAVNNKLEVWNGKTWEIFPEHIFLGRVPIIGDIATIDGVKYKRIENDYQSININN
jgi:hypothetical protein